MPSVTHPDGTVITTTSDDMTTDGTCLPKTVPELLPSQQVAAGAVPTNTPDTASYANSDQVDDTYIAMQ